MSGPLRLSDDLSLPLEAVTQTFAILARRGAGKTFTASVFAEELLEQRQRLVIADPVGVWWGLRSSADGKRPGYPVVILGGDHADLPLSKDSGVAIADLAIDNDLAVILDLSLLRKGEQRHFMTDFLEQLYHRNRRALHVILDEADAFAPQRPVKGAERLLGAVEDIVRRGRARGLGTTLISQRPAVIHKDVMTQTECLIALQTTGPQDRNAIDDWVKQHGEEAQRQQLLASLASLPVGTAWVWSPGWLDVFVKVKIRHRRTFDSSATPKAGAAVERPSEYAAVDLEALRGRLAESVEKAEQDDPKALRARIARLERELRKACAEQPEPEVREVRVEVPVITDELRDQIDRWVRNIEGYAPQFEALVSAAKGQAEWLRRLAETEPPLPQRPRPSISKPPTPIPGAASTNGDAPQVESEPKIKAGARRMLQALATPPGVRRTRAQIGTLAGMSTRSSTFSTYWSTITRAGLIEQHPDGWSITDAGIEVLGPNEIQDAPETTADVLVLWAPRVKAGARRMLDLLIEAYPQGLTRAELGERADMSTRSSTFSTYLSMLRRNGLAEVDGDRVRAGDALFPEVVA